MVNFVVDHHLNYPDRKFDPYLIAFEIALRESEYIVKT